MASFEVRGPFKIPYEKRRGGRALVFANFWNDESTQDLAEERGCYVFAVQAPRGLKPIYVGKAVKNFKQEVFNLGNRYKYSVGFSKYGRGIPLMYFVVHPPQRGKVNGKADFRDRRLSYPGWCGEEPGSTERQGR